MPKRETVVRVHDITLIDQMADHVDAARSAARDGCRNGAASERVALVKAAKLIEDVKAAGYSQVAAEGLLGQGAFRASMRSAIVNGPEASADAPECDVNKSKVKFDGKGQGRRIDRQRRRIGREAEQPASFWYKENEGEAQEGYGKADAADTGEWFG